MIDKLEMFIALANERGFAGAGFWAIGYEGRSITGKVRTVLSRGRVIVDVKA